MPITYEIHEDDCHIEIRCSTDDEYNTVRERIESMGLVEMSPCEPLTFHIISSRAHISVSSDSDGEQEYPTEKEITDALIEMGGTPKNIPQHSPSCFGNI